MPKRNELYKRFIHIDFQGGSTVADGIGGGLVSHCRFGELHCWMTEEADVNADFVDKGVICTYSPEGNLIIVTLELSQLLKCIDDRDLDAFVNGGRDVSAVIEYLDGRGEELYVMLAPMDHKFRVEQTSQEEGVITSQDFEVRDFGTGIDGEIKLGNATLAYHASRSGDEFKIAVGEVKGKERTLMPVFLSNNIDVEDSLFSGDPKRYYKLADKIFLNRSNL